MRYIAVIFIAFCCGCTASQPRSATYIDNILNGASVPEALQERVERFCIGIHMNAKVSSDSPESLAGHGYASIIPMMPFLSLAREDREAWCRKRAKRWGIHLPNKKVINAGQSDWQVEGVVSAVFKARKGMALEALQKDKCDGALFRIAIREANGSAEEIVAVRSSWQRDFDKAGYEVLHFLFRHHDKESIPLYIKALGQEGMMLMAGRYLTGLTGIDSDRYHVIDVPGASSFRHVHQLKKGYYSAPKALEVKWRSWWEKARASIRWDAEAENLVVIGRGDFRCLDQCKPGKGRFVWDE
jgi:hypothetical protein